MYTPASAFATQYKLTTLVVYIKTRKKNKSMSHWWHLALFAAQICTGGSVRGMKKDNKTNKVTSHESPYIRMKTTIQTRRKTSNYSVFWGYSKTWCFVVGVGFVFGLGDYFSPHMLFVARWKTQLAHAFMKLNIPHASAQPEWLTTLPTTQEIQRHGIVVPNNQLKTNHLIRLVQHGISCCNGYVGLLRTLFQQISAAEKEQRKE